MSNAASVGLTSNAADEKKREKERERERERETE
jgi:hypothetical protein